jgi:hypothetical protein
MDLEELRPRLAALDVSDSQDLEDFLGERLGMPVPGGHRFGDEQGALRARLSTGPLLGSTPEERRASLTSPEPLELPHVARLLTMVESTLRAIGGEPAREGWETER